MSSVALEPRIVHATPGRLRISLAWGENGGTPVAVVALSNWTRDPTAGTVQALPTKCVANVGN